MVVTSPLHVLPMTTREHVTPTVTKSTAVPPPGLQAREKGTGGSNDQGSSGVDSAAIAAPVGRFVGTRRRPALVDRPLRPFVV